MKTVNTMLSTAVAAALFSAQAVAADGNLLKDKSDLSEWEDNTWLTVSGQIKEVGDDSFVLRSGDDRLTVEFEDGDDDEDAQMFNVGDKVTVSGEVDENLFLDTSLEASSVFVHDWNTTFVAETTDNELKDRFIATATVPSDLDDMTLIGSVSSVNGETIQLTTSGVTIDVDVSELPGNPLSDDGYLHIQEGDRVKVDASIESAFYNESMVVAEALIRLNDVSEDNA
ncbi:NirD/YgiW/YdeI family stress tolerance protein [Alteromonas sp. ASW11-19]|uniref:NirD/YgiW/YdeI family stress tolerance protein n=1 Tax=Alteromonas salexigens TaxID=2982530 RepID=A0ABT2VQ80_9ALTE|nr:NirD/YgiW/YdeI family stress tolerance protein [Alteromonas salexigens]MCU7555469.1 NirD/YgiW/YdeI family stress tolerance protein [Alteromonas salexigens]